MAFKFLSVAQALTLCYTQAYSSVLATRQSSSNTATVDLSVRNGSPKHLASGFIYGIPDTLNQIPDHFYTDIGFNYARVGGAQIDAGGWIYGKAAYNARFQSTKNNYLTSRKYGASVILLPHDIWGTDHANSSTVWPGDHGNWADYDAFLNQLISDLKANKMLTGLVWDIWNEPEQGFFWQRSQQQWIDLYVRTHKRLRSDSALNGVLISGPATSSQPKIGNSWWENWLTDVKGNNTYPDQYSWHSEPSDPAVDAANLAPLLKKYAAPTKPVNLNEYATFDQQISTGAAWYIGRLERLNYLGLRGNWLSSCQLHDFMASLLGKTGSGCGGTGYYPNGEFQVYKYYNLNMTGTRAGTTATGDGVMDIYSTIGNDHKVRTLVGVLGKTGTWYVTINKLSSVGLPTSGNLAIQTWGFDDKGHSGEVDGPSNRGVYSHAYSGDSVTFPIYQTSQDQNTAWGFEFAI